jgi:peptide deformylase
MALLPIRIYPDPVLRARCEPVQSFDEELSELVANMVETMHAAPGIGLAASQVGVEKRVAVVDLSCGEREEELIAMINPEVVEERERDEDVEGCLSLPGISDKVRRSLAIRLRAADPAGNLFELEAEGLLARAILHEIDHLDGILFTDRLRGLRKERARRLLKRLAKESEASG